MKKVQSILFLLIAMIILMAACTDNAKTTTATTDSTEKPKTQAIDEPYQPASRELQDTIARLDSILFHAYNTCDLKTYTDLFSEDFEFYHDGGGLETSKAASIESYKKYVCGKVTRELMPGSIEVSPVPRFGAVEIGKHRFHNSQEPNAPSHYARFVIVWKREPGAWKITRVISLH